MSPDDQHYLDAVLAHPDDDAPRLHWAKELRGRKDPRGEFIELQVERAQKDRLGGRPAIPTRREDKLLAQYGDEWRKPFDRFWKGRPDWDSRFNVFDRGFVALIDRIDAQAFLGEGPDLFRLAPIQHVNLHRDPGSLAAVLESPLLRQLSSLALHGNSLTDDDAELIASARNLENLRWLDLSYNQIGERGVEALIASPYMANKDIIRFKDNPCDPVEKGGYYPGEQDDWIVHVDYVPFAAKLEAKYGYRPWLHVRWKKAWQAPRRF
jgi:uncharacterized protein (TIGR02996 family)